MTRDCPACGHDRLSHNSGKCNVMKVANVEGVTDYGPDGCGCTALGTDRTCPTCGKAFYCGDPEHELHDCYACYSRKQDDKDRASFAPLVAALRRKGIEVEDDPWNTGGHIMCLPVELPLPPGAPADAGRPYFMFSDHAEMLGCGLYFGDGWMNFSPTWAEREMADDEYDWAKWATITATWFRPVYDAVVGWLAAGGLTLATTKGTDTFGEYVNTEATVNTMPPVPEGTVFEPGEGYQTKEAA